MLNFMFAMDMSACQKQSSMLYDLLVIESLDSDEDATVRHGRKR